MSDLSLMVKAGVQWGLFGGAIENLGTERHHKAYVQKIIDLELLGCFAMTETGHGSDVQALETTATYDPATQEFVIDSPTRTSRKDYIGGAAETARVAAVFAQLITPDGEGHGVHCLVVPIRDDEGNDLPGVTTSDCHYKGGLPGVDNGRIQFDHVRVPRENLLNKYADVAEDGTYSSPIENPGRRFFTMLGTLIRGRVTVGGSAAAAARVALDIATRYALERRQFEAPGDDNEVLIMDYLVHQRRLFPLIAQSYALQFAQNELVAKCHELQTSDDPDAEEQRELESRAAGLKAANTWHATRAIQEAREACGGAGYLAENRLIALKADTDVFTTFEGDNHVLTQLVAKELLTAYADDIKGMSPVEWVRFAANFAGERVMKRTAAADDHADHPRHPPGQRGGGQPVQPRHPGQDVRGPRGVHDRVGGSPAAGQVQGDVPVRRLQRRSGPRAAHRAGAHRTRSSSRRSSRASTPARTTRPARSSNMVCDLYALSVIEQDRAWFMEHRFLSTERAKAVTRGVNERCRNLRPYAELLVDGFGIPEQLRYAEMLHPEHIPDADEHQEKDATSSGTIEPK